MVIEGNASLAQGRITDEIVKKNMVLITSGIPEHIQSAGVL